MKKYLLILAMFGMLFTACKGGGNGGVISAPNNPLDKYKCASNEILYISKSCRPIKLGSYNDWGANLTSNTYGEDGVGRLKFDTVVTAIPDEAFCKKSQLRYIKMPNSVTSIGDGAFNSCNNLTSVTIPNSITEIGDWAFYHCCSLTAFYGKFASADNRCLIIDGVLKSFAPAGLIEYTIPDSVTSIGDEAFDSCDNLTSVTIPDDITSIGDYAFYNCRSLTSVAIPNSITSIGDYIFFGCSSLASVTIPNSITSIGDCAFYNCSSLTSVIIPDSVTLIGKSAFEDCSSLTSVYCKPITPPTGDLYMFNYWNASGLKIYVPRSSVSAYKTTKYWRDSASYIEGYDF